MPLSRILNFAGTGRVIHHQATKVICALHHDLIERRKCRKHPEIVFPQSFAVVDKFFQAADHKVKLRPHFGVDRATVLGGDQERHAIMPTVIHHFPEHRTVEDGLVERLVLDNDQNGGHARSLSIGDAATSLASALGCFVLLAIEDAQQNV